MQNFKKNLWKVATMVLALAVVVVMGMGLTACALGESDEDGTHVSKPQTPQTPKELQYGVRYYWDESGTLDKGDLNKNFYRIFFADGTGIAYKYSDASASAGVSEFIITFTYSRLNNKIIYQDEYCYYGEHHHENITIVLEKEAVELELAYDKNNYSKLCRTEGTAASYWVADGTDQHPNQNANIKLGMKYYVQNGDALDRGHYYILLADGTGLCYSAATNDTPASIVRFTYGYSNSELNCYNNIVFTDKNVEAESVGHSTLTIGDGELIKTNADGSQTRYVAAAVA